MTIERIKGGVSYFCDLPRCAGCVETGENNFETAREAAKEEGWVFRNRSGTWKHYCCARHEEMDFMGQKL